LKNPPPTTGKRKKENHTSTSQRRRGLKKQKRERKTPSSSAIFRRREQKREEKRSAHPLAQLHTGKLERGDKEKRRSTIITSSGEKKNLPSLLRVKKQHGEKRRKEKKDQPVHLLPEEKRPNTL